MPAWYFLVNVKLFPIMCLFCNFFAFVKNCVECFELFHIVLRGIAHFFGEEFAFSFSRFLQSLWHPWTLNRFWKFGLHQDLWKGYIAGVFYDMEKKLSNASFGSSFITLPHGADLRSFSNPGIVSSFTFLVLNGLRSILLVLHSSI